MGSAEDFRLPTLRAAGDGSTILVWEVDTEETIEVWVAKAKPMACVLSENQVKCQFGFPQRERRVPGGWTELRQEYRRGLKVRQVYGGLSRCGKILCSRQEFVGGAQIFARGAGQTGASQSGSLFSGLPARDFGPLELGALR